ncbi:MAG TPA: penicillin acylase family protein, partial [Micromonosporaceae bacterium]|nr:penicillin acylase family protein [Micromonosporaceae bacterium]
MPRPSIRGRAMALGSALAVGVATVLVGLPPQPAAAAVFTSNDYCLGECSDILPPGQNGNATLTAILAHQLFGTRPAHWVDQLDKYANLIYGYSGVTDEQLSRYFNDGSFGVPAGQVESTIQPRSDVTIVRDRATGVPHITGTTRAGTMFGAGFAGAQDRLFVMDLMRRAGRGRLTPFAGGSPGNQELEQSIWRNAPYTAADLQAQVDALRLKGPRGQQLYDDVGAYITGVNAYISQCIANANCPGEYNLANQGSPQPFVMSDLIAIAGVVGGLFGGGGGGEMQSALVRIAARARFGVTVGDQVWQAFRSQNDPESVLTLHNGQSFPYGQAPAGAPSVVLPDGGTVVSEPLVYNRTGSAGTVTSTPGGAATGAGTATGAGGAAAAGAAASGTGGNRVTGGMLAGLGAIKAHGMSNAVVISGAHTTTGHPVAVFGPQTGYFSPQLLMLQELQGPGISARGAAFAGINLYVLLGRGQDYAWSATSAGQDITDTYAVPLCTTDGTPPTLQSNKYLYHGQCLPMEVIEHTNSWSPSTADPTPAGSYTLRSLRTKYGLVEWRGLVNGAPTVFTKLRSTYRHEADSAIGFQMFNDPSVMGSAAAFQSSASNVGYAFIWFYVNSTEAAYFNSGDNPVRPAGADPNLPTRADAAYEWVGWNPDTNTASYTPPSAHPQSVNQDYYISWNNKQAYDYSAADGNFSFGAVHRGHLLDRPIRSVINAGQRFDRARVVRIMAEAGVTDLRGQEVLGDLLRVVNSQPVTDPTLANVVSQLQSWRQAGSRRLETASGSRVYQHTDAIRVMDAWWPLLVAAEFRPDLGTDLYAAMVDAISVNESPSLGQNGTRNGTVEWAGHGQTHRGSAFQQGWWGYVDNDIRTVLGDPVAGGLGRTYCGGGSLSACRQMLLDTLGQAAAL